MNLTHETRFVGIDVGKFELVAVCHGQTHPRSFASTPEGIADLINWLATLQGPPSVGLEATGGYEAAVWEALEEAGYPACQLPSARIHAFARMRGTLAKTDGIDATTIAAFLAAHPDAGRTLPAKNIRQLKALSAKRRQLLDMRKALLCQMKQAREPAIIALDEAHLDLINRKVAALNSDMDALMGSDETLRERRDLLRSIAGIGPVAAATLIADMPELGGLDAKQAASLAGLAPFARDSGTRQGKRFIRGGRTTVRNVLYMAAMAGARACPEMKAFAQRLREKGKPHKQVITAVARKLIIRANAVLTRHAPWTPAAD